MYSFPAAGYSPDLTQMRVAVGPSLIAAAGFFLLMQALSVTEPSGQELYLKLQQVLATLLPEGVVSLHLSRETAPRYAEILRDASAIRFYGPQGATLLAEINNATTMRVKNEPLQVTMFVPHDKDSVSQSVEPSWSGDSDPRWKSVLESAKKLGDQGRLNLTFRHPQFRLTTGSIK
jgi:hypothetical protein